MFLSRGLRSATAVQRKGTTGINSKKVSVPNGGLSSIAFAIKAGSRHETSEGLSATLVSGKQMSSQTTTKYLNTQQLEHAGASFTAENTRDHIVYTLTSGPKLIEDLCIDVAIPAIFASQNWQWEFNELELGLHDELASLSKSEILENKLHSVSFKNGGLHNSKYVAKWRLGTGDMKAFSRQPNIIMGNQANNEYYPAPMLWDTRMKSEDV